MTLVSRPTLVPLVKGPPKVVGSQSSVVKGPADVFRGPSNVVGNSRSVVARSPKELVRAPVATRHFPRLNENREWRLNEEAKQALFAPPKLEDKADSEAAVTTTVDLDEARRLQEERERKEEEEKLSFLLAQRLEEESSRKALALVRKPTFEEARHPQVGPAGAPAPEQVPGGKAGKKAFTWIRFDNSEPARAMRRDISAQTREATFSGGYKKVGRTVKLRHVQKMLAGTRALAPSLGNLKLEGRSARRSTEVTGHDGLLLPAAFSLGRRHGDKNCSRFSSISLPLRRWLYHRWPPCTGRGLLRAVNAIRVLGTDSRGDFGCGCSQRPTVHPI